MPRRSIGTDRQGKGHSFSHMDSDHLLEKMCPVKVDRYAVDKEVKRNSNILMTSFSVHSTF